MIHNQALKSYSQHQLSVNMQTSSGDKITIELGKENTLNAYSSSNSQGSASKLEYLSSTSFNFSYEGDGLDEQDIKEINKLLEFAQPHLDNFMQELQEENNTTPINKTLSSVLDVFKPIKEQENPDLNNYAKNTITHNLDNLLKNYQATSKMIEESETFLKNLFTQWDSNLNSLYA
jgi:hypothetical protein